MCPGVEMGADPPVSDRVLGFRHLLIFFAPLIDFLCVEIEEGSRDSC